MWKEKKTEMRTREKGQKMPKKTLPSNGPKRKGESL